MALATQTHLEKFLQIDVTNEPDGAVTMLLENASGIIESYLDRRLELATHTTELHDSPLGATVFTNQWPIATSPTPVVVEDGTALTITTDFVVYYDSGGILRMSGGRSKQWRDKPQTISVTYDAGYDFTTDPLLEPEALIARDVCTRIAARVFQAAAAYANQPITASGLRSISLVGSDSVTFADSVSGAGVTVAAPQLTNEDRMSLEMLRRRVLVA